DKGHLVVYTKEDSAGIMQQFAARLVDGKSVVTQLTHQTYDCYGNMPSRFQDGKPPRVAYTHDWPIWKAKAAWIFLDQPDAPRELANFDYRQMSMWSAVSPHFLFVQKPPGAPYGQIAMSDADRGEVRVLGGELLLVCNVDNSALAIYRDEKKDGKSPWKRIATLTLPDDAPYRFISSPETIASATGVGGVSYFSLLARENKERNSRGSIWVLGLLRPPRGRRRLVRGARTRAICRETRGLRLLQRLQRRHAGKRPAPRRHGDQGGGRSRIDGRISRNSLESGSGNRGPAPRG
ncbi:MAG: hypothetical protein MUF06_24955, partial [Pirellulaceae bacterium]|nr:hypothetical protein [Pirellulaceae bacterium]